MTSGSPSLYPVMWNVELTTNFLPGPARQSWRELFSDPMLSSGSLRSKALTGLAQGEYGVPNWVPLSVPFLLYAFRLPSALAIRF
jgi:hypothetical protein